MLYRTIRTLTGRTASKLPPVTAKDGSPLCYKTDQLHRWKDHFQEQFNNPAPPLDPVLMAEAASATPDRAAFDSLDRNSLWNILKTIGIPPKLVDIIKTLYSSTHSVVRVNGTISEAFSISSGVRQGCVLAANLLNTATDRILNNTTQAMTLGVNYDDSGQLITDLDYADDIIIFADLLDTLKDALFIFNEQSKKLRLHVNWSKTKLQSFSPVTTTDNFTHIGSTIASNNSSLNDVNRRIAIATSTMSNLSSLWTSSRLSLALNMRLYNSLIITIITYSSASWTLTKAQKKRLDAFNTKSLRRILGVRWYDYVTNASILIRTGQPPLNDNNPQTTSKCLRTHLPSATRHSSHRHSGLHPTYIMAPPKRTSTTPLGRPNHQRYPDVPE